MGIHFYRMSTMTGLACGRELRDGTDFTVETAGTTCGNCKRSRVFGAAMAFDESDASTWNDLPEGYEFREVDAVNGESHLFAPDGRDVSATHYARQAAPSTDWVGGFLAWADTNAHRIDPKVIDGEVITR